MITSVRWPTPSVTTNLVSTSVSIYPKQIQRTFSFIRNDRNEVISNDSHLVAVQGKFLQTLCSGID